jgi:hypothetical protein
VRRMRSATDVGVDQHDVFEAVDRGVERRRVDTYLDAWTPAQRSLVLQRELCAREDANAEVLLSTALKQLRWEAPWVWGCSDCRTW